MEIAGDKLKEAGAKKIIPLVVSGPFHSSMLRTAGEKLEEEFKSVCWRAPAMDYYTNVTGCKVEDEKAIPGLLVRQVQSSVYWEDTIRHMLEDGVEEFVEVGPGKTLTGFIRKIDRRLRVWNIEDTATLATDLGIDSLSLINVSVRLEEISGQPIEQLEALRTVGDCILAAAGLLGTAGEAAEPPAAWFPTGEARTLSVPDGRNLVETAFRQAMRSPSRLMLADGAAVLSARDMIMRAFVLASFIKAKAGNGERIGIMLPASAAAVLVWLGALMAGKTPVMCNWTSGAANFSHGLEAAGVRRVFTSSRLLDRLSGQGFPVGEHVDVWVALEDAKRLSLPAKLGAFAAQRRQRFA